MGVRFAKLCGHFGVVVDHILAEAAGKFSFEVTLIELACHPRRKVRGEPVQLIAQRLGFAQCLTLWITVLPGWDFECHHAR